MCIERVIVKNYRTLKSLDLPLRQHLNIVVGDNETGKSTLLEAINLGLKCQINRRPASSELHPYLFNLAAVAEYVSALKSGKPAQPPRILIELYLRDCSEFAEYKGTNNSQQHDSPGISVCIGLDHEAFGEEYKTFISDPSRVNGVPVEYYKVDWRDFSGNTVHPRKFPVESALIDPSSISHAYAANKYVLEIARDFLGRKEKVELALSYRQLRDMFLRDPNVAAINVELAKKTGIVTEKTLSMSLDVTTRSGWESGVMPHLDDVPLTLIGKGEQNAVKIKLAIEAVDACILFLIEEPENHLSHSNLNRLISHIEATAGGKQLIITTHSSFVLNKLGIENVLMFNGKTAIQLSHLPPSTEAYFKKLPGHDTLRMILARKTILVEGPSDELIVQKAYLQKHGRMPLADGVEVITVRALASKRFLDIARLLNIDTCVVTDNDGDPAAVKAKFEEYETYPNIRICYSSDASLMTLEFHLAKLNLFQDLSGLFTRPFASEEDAREYMLKNKTDCALKLFDSTRHVEIPQYIENAIA